ncbi:MAG: alpha/beta fold hydrolase [Salinibacterium sp.]|nr:alpha/beta fold hydrolase [Salinibacterium sp.]
MASQGPHLFPISGRAVATAAIGAGALVAGALIGAGVLAVVFARTVITPPTRPIEDVKILAFDDATVTLSVTLDSMTPGRYSLWFQQDRGHARVGEIVSYTADTVTRQLIAVDFGDLHAATRGRLGGWFYLGPADLELPFDDVLVTTEFGPAPAWYVPAAAASTRWMIGVHGRAVRRQETLRAVPVFRDEGYNSLLLSYRNDGDAPSTPDHRYSLGDTEWKDIEAGMRYALDHGATSIVLMGWSMGGATVLQAVTRSPLAESVAGVVLDSPVVDWITALNYQGMVYRLPKPVRSAVIALLSSRWSTALVGLSAPIDVKRLDLVTRANELTKPILLLHSDGDDFIPSTASRALALARPDIVTFDEFTTARHTRLWNYDPDRWNTDIRRWLDRLG